MFLVPPYLPTKAEYQQATDFCADCAGGLYGSSRVPEPGDNACRPRGAGLEHIFGANIRLPWEQRATR